MILTILCTFCIDLFKEQYQAVYFYSLSIVINFIVIESLHFILESILDNFPVEKDASQEEFELDDRQGDLPKVSSPVLVSTL